MADVDFDIIEFKNDSEPPLNAQFLNGLQGKLKTNLEKMFEVINEAIVEIKAQGGDPIGTGKDYYGEVEPEGYMFADGRELSRTEYSALFNVIGTKYGEGNGSTTFNLPDKRERVTIMKNNTGTFNILGKKGGSETVTLTVDNIPTHAHSGVVTSVATDQRGSVSGTGVQYAKGGTTGSTANTGKGTAFSITQPYLVCNYIIKVK